jgi:hypothetical protein
MGILREAEVMVSVQGLVAQSFEDQGMGITTCCICTDYVYGPTNDPENCQTNRGQISQHSNESIPSSKPPFTAETLYILQAGLRWQYNHPTGIASHPK